MSELLPQIAVTDEALTALVVGADGDLKLVAEQLHCDPAVVLQRFIATPQTSHEGPLRAALLLTLLQLMVETKNAVLANLEQFSPRDAIEVLKLTTSGLRELGLSAGPPVQPGGPMAAFQFNFGQRAIEDPEFAKAADVILQQVGG